MKRSRFSEKQITYAPRLAEGGMPVVDSWVYQRRRRGWPQSITVENGTEFTSRALDDLAYRRGAKLDYTRPGKLTDKGRSSHSTACCAMNFLTCISSSCCTTSSRS